MSYTNPHSKQLSINTPPGGDVRGFVSVPGDDRMLLNASASSSTLEANPGYDQVRRASCNGEETFRPWHFLPPQSQVETWFALVQMGLQPNFPPLDASTTEFYNYTQHHGTGGHFTNQYPTEDHRKRTMSRNARPICTSCTKDFGRFQELERHVKEVHMPWQCCPFCEFMWARPAKIKAHIIAEHADKFTVEMLEGIKSFCGQRIVDFVGGYYHGLDLGAASQSHL